MLTAHPKHWYSWEFVVQASNGDTIGEVRLSGWRERGTITTHETEYKVFRQGLLGDFVIEGGGTILARAQKPSALRSMFLLQHNERQYTLKARSFMFRELVLYEGEHEVGAIAPETAFTRRARVQLPEGLPLPVRLFILWLALLLWKRDQDSSGTGSTST